MILSYFQFDPQPDSFFPEVESSVLIADLRGSNIGLAGCEMGQKIDAGYDKYQGWDM